MPLLDGTLLDGGGEGSALHSPGQHAAELQAAEAVAKKANLKVWVNYSAEEEEAARAAAQAMAQAELEPVSDDDKQKVELEITEIVDGSHFYAQVAGDAAVTALAEKLKALCKATSAGPFEPKAGMTVCAQFTQDDEWYRAKITALLQAQSGDRKSVV